MARIRSWCFTLNNYTDDEYNSIINSTHRYLVVGKEIGENQTPHLQGYVEFTSAKTLSAVKKTLGSDRIHLEKRRGTPRQASDYCKKDNDFIELGEMSSQGERTDLTEIKDMILSGTPIEEIMTEYTATYAKYRNTFKDLADLAHRKLKRTEMTKGTWIHGPTGVGKSHMAFEMAGDDVYVKPSDGQWWDGYTGQKTVVINDFRGDIKYSELLQIIDKWPHSVPRRGRQPIPFTSEHVIITSSLPPEQVYNNLAFRDNIDQLIRRLNIIHLTK